MPLSTVRNPAEWEQYRRDVADQLKTTIESVQWGNGPQAFPCMVASVQLDRGRVATAYFYLSNAIALLQEAGCPLPKPAATAVAPAGDPKALNPESVKENARQVNAHLWAIVHFLTETGICKRKQYEAVVRQKLVEVDQMEASGTPTGLRVADDDPVE